MQNFILPNNKIIALGIALSFGAVFAGTDDLNYRIEDGVIKIGPEKKSIESVSPENRAAILKRIRAKLIDWRKPITIEEAATSAYHQAAQAHCEAAMALLQLGDEETIWRLVEQFQTETPHCRQDDSNPAAELLDQYGNEAVIPYLIGNIYDGQSVGKWGDVKCWSTLIVLRIIKHSSAFPPEAKKWAGNLLEELVKHMVHISPQIVGQIDEWWDLNKEAIGTKHYDKATKLPKTKLNFDFERRLRESPPPPPTPPPIPEEN